MIKILKIKNIFTDEERKRLLRDCESLLYPGDNLVTFKNNFAGKYPAKQTYANLYEHPKFKDAHIYLLNLINERTKFDLKISRSWILKTTGKSSDQCWHNHLPNNAKWVAVYYIKTQPYFDNGTNFEHGFVRTPQNSLLFFPASLNHAPPTSPFRFSRYTLSIDLVDNLR